MNEVSLESFPLKNFFHIVDKLKKELNFFFYFYFLVYYPSYLYQIENGIHSDWSITILLNMIRPMTDIVCM